MSGGGSAGDAGSTSQEATDPRDYETSSTGTVTINVSPRFDVFSNVINNVVQEDHNITMQLDCGIDSDIDDYTDEALHTTRQLLASRLFSIEYINKYYGFIFKEKNGEMLENLYYKDRIYTAKLIARIDCIFEQRAAESVEQIPHYKFNDLSVNMSRIIATKNFCEQNM